MYCIPRLTSCRRHVWLLAHRDGVCPSIIGSSIATASIAMTIVRPCSEERLHSISTTTTTTTTTT